MTRIITYEVWYEEYKQVGYIKSLENAKEIIEKIKLSTGIKKGFEIKEKELIV